jgi:hypothetical protein
MITAGPDLVTALDALVQQVADRSLADRGMRNCLAGCPACRNSVLYLLDAAGDGRPGPVLIGARLRALPLRHEGHGDPAHPDWVTPRIQVTGD